MNRRELTKLVVNDLNTLEFYTDHVDGDCVYHLIHPDSKYSLWTANGFWFTGIDGIGGKRVDETAEGNFGLIGRFKVWRATVKHLRRIRQEYRDKQLYSLKS